MPPRNMILCCGLIIVGSKKPVPLKEISVDVQVKGFVGDVTATLKYENLEENAVEAVFVFPMDNDSAVYRFEATVEGKTIVADIQEKEQAHKTYDEAISQGHQAFLLEEDKSSGDIFSCSVGNLLPGQKAEVTLCYVRELPVEADGAVRFVLPAVLNPRYTPEDEQPSITATRPRVPIGQIPYTLSLSAHFQSAYGISKIESNCDITPMEYTDSDKTAAKVSLTRGHAFDRDVELLAYYAEVNKPSAAVELGVTGDKEGSVMADPVVMLNFYPSFPEAEEQSNFGEFIFLMDRSGSMGCAMSSKPNSPQRIQSAKDTLVLLLKSLPLGCYFNVFGFGSTFESFFPESMEYTQTSMEEAVKKAKEMEANLGGTEILKPLKKIYETCVRPDHPRQLFVFTDGEVGNTKSVINEVRKNALKHRCFTFGIGEGASTALIKGMAQAANGSAEFITGEDRMQPKVLKALKHSLQASVREVALTWTLPPGLELVPLSKTPEAIFQGQRSIVYAQLKGKVDFPATREVSLEYKYKEEVFRNVLPLTIPTSKAERPTIHRLAAKALISKLEDGEDSESEEIKKNILETSIQSGVISSLTAYVAVNKDTKKLVEGPPVRRDIPAPGLMMRSMSMGARMHCGNAPTTMLVGRPVRKPLLQMCSSSSTLHTPVKKCAVKKNLERNSDMLQGLMMSSMSMGAQTSYPVAATTKCLHPRLSKSHYSSKVHTPVKQFAMDEYFMCDSVSYAKGMNSASYMAHSIPEKACESPSFRLISLQNANGSWSLSSELAIVLGTTEDVLKSKKPPQSNDDSVWVTLLAVIWLHATCSGERDEWDLPERKARFWLIIKAVESLGELVKAGNELLKSSVDPKVFGLRG